MRILTIVLRIMISCILTMLTQIGGVMYLISLVTYQFIVKKARHIAVGRLLKCAWFMFLYLAATFLIVPLLAKPFGRVPMPIKQQGNIKPLHIITCILNRHYVRPALKNAVMAVSIQMNSKYPGTIVSYLDAGFPFIHKFPLFPHLSHNDGKKIDLAFFYTDKETGSLTNSAPSPIGYGISEAPTPGEINMAEICSAQGYTMYSILTKLVPQGNKKYYIFDAARTRDLVNCFAGLPQIGKIFIEPHLKTRMQLTNSKIRFQGCQAVRHDDHVHIQLN